MRVEHERPVVAAKGVGMRTRHRIGSALAVGALVATGLTAGPASAHPQPGETPIATGYGGAVVSDTVESTQAGIDILRRGGNGGRRGGRGGRHPRGDRPVRRRARWRRFLRVLRRAQGPSVHNRRPGDHTRGRLGDDVRRPGDRPALPVQHRGDQRSLGRRARHAGHVGACPAAVGSARPGRHASARDPRGRPWLRRRPDVPLVDPVERRAVRAVQLHGRAVPARWRAAGGRHQVAQPRPRRHLP